MVRSQKGDTLVEVLMSIVVLSVIIVGSTTLMARGLTAGQNALEHSEVRQGVNGQLEMLRYLRDQYSANSSSSDAATWTSIVTSSNASPTDYSSGCNVTTTKAGTAFYLNKVSGVVQRTAFNPSLSPTTFAVPGQGMWLEVTPSSAISPAYIDIVVRACWSAVGSQGAQQQTVTAERLYDPSR